MTKEHFFVSPTGAVFILSRLGSRWFLLGPPDRSNSTTLWPVGSSLSFNKLVKYIKCELGFVVLR